MTLKLESIGDRRGLRWALRMAACVSLSAMGAAAPIRAAEDFTRREVSAEAMKIEGLYTARCAVCHDAATGRTPPRAALMFVPPKFIAQKMTGGSMKPMAEGLSEEEIHLLAVHLSALPDRAPVPHPAPCGAESDAVRSRSIGGDQDDWRLTSRDGANTRLQPNPELTAEGVPQLALAWSLAIPGGAAGSPIVSGGRLFISSGGGEILALDAKRGCTLWTFEHGAIVRTLSLGDSSASGGKPLVLFADDGGMAFALDAATGDFRWATKVEDHPLNRATAAPGVHDGRVFVTMSSIEDPLTHDPSHTCCTSRGSVTALDAATGKRLWKQYTVEKTPVQIAPPSDLGPAQYSPAGGSIYTPVTIDSKRGLVYVSTAEAYTNENSDGTYAVIAFSMESGERVWERQFLPAPEDREGACAKVVGTDCRNVFSMGTSVMLYDGTSHGGGQDLLIVGQKWGFVYALDPDKAGEIVWQQRVAKGGDMGGVMYGLAADSDAIYVPISDVYAELPDRPGDLVALDPTDGRVRWRAKQPDAVCSWGMDASCVGAQPAAPTVIPGVVFASAWDGFVRAHSSSDGELIWQFDTGRKFESINGTAQGGQISAYPIQVVEGHVYVTSGASSLSRPGNALLVFSVPH
jgi:polyvinyl alcohol dehydrogenase (cytochrome)